MISLHIETRLSLITALIAMWAVISVAANEATPAGESPGLKEVYQQYFRLGTAIPSADLPLAEIRLLTHNFSSVTPENLMKPKYFQPAEGRFEFADSDRFVAFAERQGLQVHGHTLVWHQQTPAWIFRDGSVSASRDLVLQRMTNHIAKVVGRYRGRIASWDVVNEAIDDGDGFLRKSPWLELAGEDFIGEAFRAAHRADSAAKLYYNDYSIESPPKREKALRLIRDLKAAGVPIDCIGIQGHWRLGRVPFQDIEAAIVAFHAEGLKVAISELDLDLVPRAGDGAEVTRREAVGADVFADGCPPQLLQRQAEDYAELFRLFCKHADKIDRVTFWGLHDGRSWLNYWPSKRTNYPLLWDRELKPKPALTAVVRAADAESNAGDK